MDEVVDRNSLALLKKVTSHQLYDALLLQLRKDFKVANVNLVFKDQAKPNEVVRELYHTINHLILHRFNDYLNLLYAVDVPEKQIKQLENNSTFEIAKQVTLLILKREWQKVWFRKKYS